MSQNGVSILGSLQLLVSTIMLVAVGLLLVRVFIATAPAPETARASLEQMKYSAYTNAQAAHVTVTNMNPSMHWACIQGSVTSKKTNASAMTVAVCTGDMKPHTTVSLDAPYKIGAVEELCSRSVGTGEFAHNQIDWDLCDFDIINSP